MKEILSRIEVHTAVVMMGYIPFCKRLAREHMAMEREEDV
jgi:hypothetical protein